MTPAEARHDVQRLVAILSGAGVLLRSNPIVVLTVGRRRLVSWARPGARAPLWIGNAATVAEYRNALRGGDYTCLLSDGALLQIEFAFEGNHLVHHRLCWMPCPVPVPEIQQDDPIEDVVDILLADASDQVLDDYDPTRSDDVSLLLVTPLRFDFDPDLQAEDHAASHLTLCGSGCRIPVFGALSLGHFVRTVFRHFYAEIWRSEQDLREWTVRQLPRVITVEEQRQLHIEWRFEA